MQALRDERREKFCQIVALEGVDTATACFRAGYGRDSHPTCDHYHVLAANRLMEREDVNKRINTIRMLYGKSEKGYKEVLVEKLKAILDFNPLKYYASNEVKLNNGRTVTDIYLSKPVQNWDFADARLVNGFDNRGMPKFIDKQWAFEKLIKIYQLDGSLTADVEDILGLFMKAKLPSGDFYADKEESDDTDINAELLSHQIEEDIGL